MMQPGYFDRKYTGFPNGHATVGSMPIKYDEYEGIEGARAWAGRASRRGGWYWSTSFPA